MTAPVVRFAPSPTGQLHLGNVRTALVNYLFARAGGGRFILRIDDTDAERSRPDFETSILEDLRWLGLDWDGFARQSDRVDRYRAAADRLTRSGRLYPAFETPDELDLKRKLAVARGRPPIYDRAALALAPEEVAHRLASGERASWRFRLIEGAIAWHDLVRGETRFEAALLSDPILVRPDGQMLYTLSSVVDDIELGVSHVIRGEDHVTNTAVQVQLFEALEGAVPAFGHFALIADAEGGKLSKRTGSQTVGDLRASGLEPMAINSLLAKLGTSDPVDIRADMTDLIAEFDIGKFGRARPKLDPEDLLPLNARLMQMLPFDRVASRLPPGSGEDFWLAIRGNIGTIAEAATWHRVVAGPIAPVSTDLEFLQLAAGLMPPAPWDSTSWKVWTNAVKDATGRTGRALFLPLRLALTGLDHGPEMARLLPLIGPERVRARLAGGDLPAA